MRGMMHKRGNEAAMSLSGEGQQHIMTERIEVLFQFARF